MKRFLLLVVSLMMCWVTAVSASYRDVETGSALHDAAQFLQVRGGLEVRTHLLPDVLVTRVAFLKMLLAPITLSGQDAARVEQITLAFTDLEEFAWYIPSLKKAVFLGIIENKPVPFLPNDSVRRGDGLEWIITAYGFPKAYMQTNIDRVYADVFPDSHYKYVVARAQKYKLLEAHSDRLFGVLRPIKRGEAAMLIHRAHQAQQALATTPVVTGQSDELPVITIDTSVTESFDGWNGELYRLVLQQIEEQYLFADEIDYEALAYGAVQGMVKALGDPYTEFLPPVEAESFEVSLGGQVEGIGTYVQGVDLGLRIDAIIPGTPAEAAGLQVGDVMISANGESLKGMSSSKAASKIRGPKGTTVTLEVMRDGLVLSFSVVRDAFEVTSIVQEMKDGMYIIRIADFRDTTGAEFATYVEELQKQPKGTVVLDLRNNGGGYLSSSVQILRHFAKEGEMLVQLDYGVSGGVEDYEAKENGVLSDMKLFVLVNENTASAAEILVGTLQDYGRATLVGEQTYGKGTVQSVIDFTDASSLKITVGRWLTGGGRWVNAWEDASGEEIKGLMPDVVVARTSTQEMQSTLAEEIKELDSLYEKQLFEKLQEIQK